MKYDRTVIAYHGCDAQVAARLIDGEPFRPSSNDFDWLGEGIYFWEYGYDRALQFAEEQRARGKVERPCVVGALLQLGSCFLPASRGVTVRAAGIRASPHAFGAVQVRRSAGRKGECPARGRSLSGVQPLDARRCPSFGHAQKDRGMSLPEGWSVGSCLRS